MMSTNFKRHFYIGRVLNVHKQQRVVAMGLSTTVSSLSYLALWVYLPLQVQSVSKLGSWFLIHLQAPNNDSDDEMKEETMLTFTGHYHGHELQPYTLINHQVYHFRPGSFTERTWQLQVLQYSFHSLKRQPGKLLRWDSRFMQVEWLESSTYAVFNETIVWSVRISENSWKFDYFADMWWPLSHLAQNLCEWAIALHGRDTRPFWQLTME